MTRLIKVTLILATIVLFITGVFAADDPEPQVLSAWDQNVPASPIFPDWPAALRQTIKTWEFNPPAPDAVGLAYLPASNTLLMSDSEVEETDLFEGYNLFEMTLQGDVQWIGTTSPFFTNEPVGLSVNSFNNHLFVVDDQAAQIFEVDPGTDGDYFTNDDTFSVFFTDRAPMNAHDPEGVAYNPWTGTLYILEDTIVNNVVEPSVLIELDPGANGVFDGVPPAGDDTVTQTPLDDVDPDPNTTVEIRGAEDIAFNWNTGTLYVSDTRSMFLLEITTDGEWVRRINVSQTASERTDGLAYGPSSINPNEFSLYIADRGLDEVNDGKIYEVSLPGPTSGNNAPSVDAGENRTVQLPNQVDLAGNVTDDGVPVTPFPLATYWRMVSGPAAVTFADNTDPTTTASFTAPGTYVLRLTASDSQLSSFDEVTITVENNPDNEQPVVEAGDDMTVAFPGPVTLTGSVSDDGPVEELTLTWSRTSGPGEVTFVNRNAVETTATFSEPGTYVLRLTVSDGELTAYDEVTVQVEEDAVTQSRLFLPLILK